MLYLVGIPTINSLGLRILGNLSIVRYAQLTNLLSH